MKDLHYFLSQYEETFPEEVIHIDREVSARYHVTALTTHLESEKRFPVLVFHNVLNDHGKSPFPLVTFLMASRKRLAGLLETSIEMARPAFCQRVQNGIKPVVVPRGRAPVKEVVEVGDAVDLRAFPALIHHEMDPGPYITVGFLVDIFDVKEVLLALATRFQGDRDLMIIENCMGSGLDPSADGPIGSKVGFDCTVPAPPAQFPHRLKVPAGVLDQVKLEDFIPKERLLQIPYEPWG